MEEHYTQKSEEELLAIKHQKPVPNAITRDIDSELQRRLQAKNVELTAKLINEVQTLKEITDTNARTSNESAQVSIWLSRVAIVIAVIGVLVQAFLSIHRTVNCADFGEGEIHCYTWVDLGYFGPVLISETTTK